MTEKKTTHQIKKSWVPLAYSILPWHQVGNVSSLYSIISQFASYTYHLVNQNTFRRECFWLPVINLCWLWWFWELCLPFFLHYSLSTITQLSLFLWPLEFYHSCYPPRVQTFHRLGASPFVMINLVSVVDEKSEQPAAIHTPNATRTVTHQQSCDEQILPLISLTQLFFFIEPTCFSKL